MSSSEIDPKPTTIGNKVSMAEMLLQEVEYQADMNQYSSSFIVKHLPHDLKVQILFQAPDMCTMLALTTAYPEFMKAFEDAPRAIMTKVVIRQLGLNGFNVNHPLLDLLHHLGYPSTLDWNNDKAFTSGLKALHEVILGHRKSCSTDGALFGTTLMSFKVR